MVGRDIIRWLVDCVEFKAYRLPRSLRPPTFKLRPPIEKSRTFEFPQDVQYNFQTTLYDPVPSSVVWQELQVGWFPPGGGLNSQSGVQYITKAIVQYFGHNQVGLVGQSVYCVIHPDDHEIKQSRTSGEHSSRSFFCRTMERAPSRKDPGRHGIIHVADPLRLALRTEDAVSFFSLCPGPIRSYAE